MSHVLWRDRIDEREDDPLVGLVNLCFAARWYAFIVASRTFLEIISGIKGLEILLKVIVEQSSIPVLVLSKMFSKSESYLISTFFCSYG